MNSMAESTSGNILLGKSPQESDGASISLKSDELLNFNIGRELVRYRNLTGFSENEVAESLGVSKNYVRLMEWGLVCNVSPKLRQRILELVQNG